MALGISVIPSFFERLYFASEYATEKYLEYEFYSYLPRHCLLLMHINNKFQKIAKRILIISVIVYFSYLIINAIIITRDGLAEVLSSENKLLANDSSLFKPEALQEISVFEVLRSTARNPISMVFYKENNIIFFRIDLRDSMPGYRILNIKKQSSNESVGHAYRMIENHNFLTMYAKSGRILPASMINFLYDGDSFEKEIENDSIMSYRFLCDNFSIKHEKDGPVDFHVETNDWSYRPINILFWRKDKSVYVFFMTPGKKEGTLEGESLLKVLNIK